MSPTCSSRSRVGRKTRSAADLTKRSRSPWRDRAAPARAEAYVMALAPVSDNRAPEPRGPPARAAPTAWYVRRALKRRWPALAALGTALAPAGCDGGGEERQAGAERGGTFAVAVRRAPFPTRQRLAERSRLVIAVRNAGRRPIPNVAVTVEGLSEARAGAELADPVRPVFALDSEPRRIAGLPEAAPSAPRGCETAYVSTWACGRLAPGRAHTFRWTLTAVRAGRFAIRWRVAAALDGSARAVLVGGGRPRGGVAGTISSRPAPSRVANDGRAVLRGRP